MSPSYEMASARPNKVCVCVCFCCCCPPVCIQVHVVLFSRVRILRIAHTHGHFDAICHLFPLSVRTVTHPCI